MKEILEGEDGEKSFLKLDADWDDCQDSLWHKIRIKTSVDIDSMIAVMHKLTLSADIEISVLPTGGSKPPLTKSNHTWVHLLQPQSQDDKDSGRRREWFETSHPSEMHADRAPLVHLCFRSSYGLYYEPFRKVRGGEIPLCDDWDAYYTNKDFFSSLQNYQRIMEEAKGKSLGVRDELRGSLAAVSELLNDLPQLVRLPACFCVLLIMLWTDGRLSEIRAIYCG